MTDLENMILYAARYAHTRQTGAALQVVECIENNWDDITPKVRKQLIEEAGYEATCNFYDWQKLIDLDK